MRSRQAFVVVALLGLLMALGACGPELLTGAPASEGDGPFAETQTENQLVGELAGTRLRLMTGNLSSGKGQDYNLGHGLRIFQGLKPDIAMVQEFSYGADSAADLRTFVDAAFGPAYTYARGTTGNIPNGVVSRYPIIASGDWDDTRVNNREFTWARIDVPGASDLWAVSVHLLTTGTGERAAESAQLVKYIQDNVPPGDFVVIGGDFNTGSRTENALGTLSKVAVTAAPWPADRKGNGHTNAGRNKPYDWLIVSSNLSALSTATVIGSSTFAGGLVGDTRVYSPIEEIAPALANDSSAAAMQHMGVVRDFDLQTATPGPSASIKVLAPNGGEVMAVGSTQTILWSSTSVSSVNIAFSQDGSTFTPVASSLSAAAGTYSWVVPASATSLGRIKVSDAANASVLDVSDGAFTVQATMPSASVTLISPNGGESFTAGSTQTIQWSATGLSTVDVAYSADGTAFTRIASGLAASTGGMAWTVPAAPTAAGRIRVSDSAQAGVSATSAAAFIITAAGSTGHVIINEILANEPGSDSAGEFVELVNIGGSAVDLSGWVLSDSTASRHTFASATSLAPGAALVVYGKASAAPAGIAAVGASSGTLHLGNSGDSVKLASGQITIDSFAYGPALSGTDGVSMNRSPDRAPLSVFVLHTTLSSKNASPGTAP